MKKCFVIMPFSKTTTIRTERYWKDHFKNFLKPKIESFEGLIAERSKALRGQILKEIIRDLISSDIVVADLTDHNPNVFYELGIRQSFKHGTITIAEAGTKIPFDITGKGVLFYYPKDHIKNAEFEENFTEALRDCVKNPNKPDSVVLESTIGRGSFYELIQNEEIGRRLFGLISEFNYNKKYFDKLLKHAKLRDKDELSTFTTGLFRYACIELLISNRYLSEIDQFYEICDTYYDILISFNARIFDLPYKTAMISEWIISRETFVRAIFQQFAVVSERATSEFC